MCKLCWLSVLLLVMSLLGMTYKFIIRGNVAPASDGRVALQLTEDERNLVLGEMRAFLASVQQIVQGIAEEDMGQVATAATRVGRAVQGDMPGTLVGKLPIEFKKLGFDTHSKFDQLSLDAREFADSNHTLAQLGELLQNCVGCHAAYRIGIEADSLR